ncbi:dethiobiotin synthase [Bermanella marisrubri]|nr:dethiobiotin synthase [Bermanella marisrubri]QIZ85025.1 dethiobiotin synthase [Bermanella marisrubri]
MAKQIFFIAGTDTDAGKTFIASGLLAKAKQAQLSTLGLKPVAAGCSETDQGLRNDDAMKLMTQSTVQLSYEQVNPIALQPAIAPHIAAQRIRKPLSAERIVGLLRGVLMTNKAEFTLIEGAGGYRVPLNPRETLADCIKELRTPVVLVVGMKLGCLNHALLTVEAIKRDGLHIAGWVANQIDPAMSAYDENIETLRAMIPAPCLGVVPHIDNNTAEAAAEYLTLPSMEG